MPGLIEEINSQEEAIRYAQEDPDKALGVVIWNLMLLKKQCTCRLASCRAEQKQSRLKNVAIQIGGSFAGGAAVLYGIWVVHKENILAAVAEYVKRKMGS